MARKCPYCGKKLRKDDFFCNGCGSRVEGASQNGDLEEVVGAWAYVGYSFLFSIPLIGFILTIVFACNHSNQNIKNYARSILIMYVIAVIFVVLYALCLFGIFGPMLAEIMRELMRMSSGMGPTPM